MDRNIATISLESGRIIATEPMSRYCQKCALKSFPAVEDIYEGVKVEKLEHIGHVQKRAGNRLRNLKKNVERLSGRGRLTDNIIDKLQNYYGMVIRQNSGDLNAMKSASSASLFHVASSDTNYYHTDGLSGSDS